MFSKDKNDLELNSYYTYGEINQQPSFWSLVAESYITNREKIKVFFDLVKNNKTKPKIIFTGAGSSSYVGDAVVPYLSSLKELNWADIESVATTELISTPTAYLKEKVPTLLVSIARSGNSPESIAAVSLARSLVKNLYELTITCSEQGALAKEISDKPNHLLFIMPEGSNDKGFAMTSSFTCMTLMSLLVFEQPSLGHLYSLMDKLVTMGNIILSKKDYIKNLVDDKFSRVVTIGSGSLKAFAKETSLKILELTAGKISTISESSLGLRHGPKAFIDSSTIVIAFRSSDEYTSKYDVDITSELRLDGIAKKVYTVSAYNKNSSRELSQEISCFDQPVSYAEMPDPYLGLAYIIFSQLIGFFSAIKLSVNPDQPFPKGTVNRVVKGVTIYEF